MFRVRGKANFSVFIDTNMLVSPTQLFASSSRLKSASSSIISSLRQAVPGLKQIVVGLLMVSFYPRVSFPSRVTTELHIDTPFPTLFLISWPQRAGCVQ